MAPINIKEWEPVLKQVDLNLFSNPNGYTIAIVRSWHQGRENTGQRKVYGGRGIATINIDKNLIIEVKICNTDGSSVFSTRTSLQHHLRTGHSSWWTAVGKDNHFATECGCIPAQFGPDYPTTAVTPFEENCKPARIDDVQKINSLKRKVAELEGNLEGAEKLLGDCYKKLKTAKDTAIEKDTIIAQQKTELEASARSLRERREAPVRPSIGGPTGANMRGRMRVERTESIEREVPNYRRIRVERTESIERLPPRPRKIKILRVNKSSDEELQQLVPTKKSWFQGPLDAIEAGRSVSPYLRRQEAPNYAQRYLPWIGVKREEE